MKIISDLHFHSKYSRAVSQNMILPEIARWAKVKGIDLVTTSDFTHPVWFREIKAGLEEAGEGIYKIKSEIRNSKSETNLNFQNPKFILTTEISCIYSQGGKGRRIHLVVMAPSISEAEKINLALGKRGNLLSDGRPILGMSAHDLTALVLETSPEALVVPAHIWTPWFSLYGSESGFDSIDECFGDMAKNIFAVETGLSSDPVMNWRIGEMDNRSIVSNSDAHSGAKLGREATVLEIPDGMELSYQAIRKALINEKLEDGSGKIDDENGSWKEESNIQLQNPTSNFYPHISKTLEFYPEEGKYHYTGHRNCNIRQTPEETKTKGETCPVCKKGLTVGVMHRVEKLATRGITTNNIQQSIDEFGVKWIGYEKRPPYAMLVPLQEILAEALESTVFSQKTQDEYKKLTDNFGGEFNVLLQTKPENITSLSGEKVAEGILKVRSGKIVVEPGYDGVFGTVKIWNNEEGEGDKGDGGNTGEIQEQMTLL
jgi:PHP family Zn ribbon phosphoesterase